MGNSIGFEMVEFHYKELRMTLQFWDLFHESPKASRNEKVVNKFVDPSMISPVAKTLHLNIPRQVKLFIIPHKVLREDHEIVS
jgi:hypothetical protein